MPQTLMGAQPNPNPVRALLVDSEMELDDELPSRRRSWRPVLQVVVALALLGGSFEAGRYSAMPSAEAVDFPEQIVREVLLGEADPQRRRDVFLYLLHFHGDDAYGAYAREVIAADEAAVAAAGQHPAMHMVPADVVLGTEAPAEEVDAEPAPEPAAKSGSSAKASAPRKSGSSAKASSPGKSPSAATSRATAKARSSTRASGPSRPADSRSVLQRWRSLPDDGGGDDVVAAISTSGGTGLHAPVPVMASGSHKEERPPADATGGVLTEVKATPAPAPAPEAEPPQPKARPWLSMEPDVKDVEGDPKAVAMALSSRKAAFLACYTKALREEPGIVGDIELSWAIEEGRARYITAVVDTVGSTRLDSCLRAQVRRTRLPSDVNGQVYLPMAFVLEPK